MGHPAAYLKFRSVVDALRRKGLLTEEDAETVRPSLEVTVNLMQSTGLGGVPRPDLSKWGSDPRISIDYR